MSEDSCIKCRATSPLIYLPAAAAYFCHDCYSESIKVKFRSVLSKTKLIPKGHNPNHVPVPTLILFEWDTRAKVLLQLVNEVNNETNTKKRYRIDPKIYAVHSSRTNIDDDSIKEFEGLKINNIHLSSVLGDVENGSDDEKLNLYNSLLDVAPTKSIEFELRRLMFDLLAWRLAEKLNVNIVLMSENSELIAQKSITALWFGRSTSVAEIADIMDARHEKVRIVRPLRNITDKELEFLDKSNVSTEFSTFGDSISSNFLDNVAENGFPSIVTTVLSVASKLDIGKGSSLDKLKDLSIADEKKHCTLCQKKALNRLCEPCQRLIAQIKEDKQDFVLNTLCPV